MTKKAATPEVKSAVAMKPVPEVKKVRTSKPSSNPFTQQHPGRPGRSANGGTPGSKRGS